MTWLVDKLDPDAVFRAAVYKEHVEADVDSVHCVVDVACPDNVIAYLATRAVENASAEVKAAALQLLNSAFRCGALRHNDSAVFRRAAQIFQGDLRQVHYEAKHADEARGLMAKELRKCVVCKIDVYTLFERFVRCVEVDSVNFTYAIRRPDGVFHVIVKDPADALDPINRLLTAQYRVAVDSDLETFETLTKIHAKPFCYG